MFEDFGRLLLFIIAKRLRASHRLVFYYGPCRPSYEAFPNLRVLVSEHTWHPIIDRLLYSVKQKSDDQMLLDKRKFSAMLHSYLQQWSH